MASYRRMKRNSPPEVFWLKQHSLNAINFYIYISLLAFFPSRPDSFYSARLNNIKRHPIFPLRYHVFLFIPLSKWKCCKIKLHRGIWSAVSKHVEIIFIFLNLYSSIDLFKCITSHESGSGCEGTFKISKSLCPDSSSECRRSWHEWAELRAYLCRITFKKIH